MKPLKSPLEPHLAPPLDEARLHRLAVAVQARRNAPRRPLRLMLAALAVIALTIAWTLLSLPTLPSPLPPALALASGDALPTTLVKPVTLSDGSRIDLDEDAQAEVIANQPNRLALVLRAGRARFEVTPGGPRQWVIDAGKGTIEVIGTVFTVDRRHGLVVTVERGVVAVRSPLLADGVQRLTAGHTLDLAAPQPTPVVPRAVPPIDAGPAPVQVHSPRAAERAQPAPEKPWKFAAQHGDLTRAWQLLDHGFERAVAEGSSDELLLLADVARNAAQPRDAALALRRFLQLAPGDANEAAATFSLARVELELKQSAEAARHFAAVAAGDGPLAEEAALRRVTALLAAGDDAGARLAAEAFIAKSPRTARAQRVQRWLDVDAGAPWPW